MRCGELQAPNDLMENCKREIKNVRVAAILHLIHAMVEVIQQVCMLNTLGKFQNN